MINRTKSWKRVVGGVSMLAIVFATVGVAVPSTVAAATYDFRLDCGTNYNYSGDRDQGELSLSAGDTLKFQIDNGRSFGNPEQCTITVTKAVLDDPLAVRVNDYPPEWWVPGSPNGQADVTTAHTEDAWVWTGSSISFFEFTFSGGGPGVVDIGFPPYEFDGQTILEGQSWSFPPPGPVVPDAPTGLGATAGEQKITLAWTAPDDGGSAITDYEYSSDTGSNWASLNTIGTSATITGLANGTAYTLIIRAVNVVGNGAQSASVTATPGPLKNADGSYMSTDPSASSGDFFLNQDGTTQSGIKDFVAGEYIEIIAATNSETDIALRLDAPPDSGQSNVSAIGVLTYEAGGTGRATGRGFKPGTTAVVYLFSDPLFLGNTTVQSDGTWEKVFDVPADIAPGPHTIQAQGVLPDGSIKAVTAGVWVVGASNPPSAEPALPVPAMPGLVWLLVLLLGGLGIRFSAR